MTTPARLIRTILDDVIGPDRNLPRGWEDRRDVIVTVGRTAMAQYGRGTITMTEFAIGLRLQPRQVRAYITDLDTLFAAILGDHMRDVGGAVIQAAGDAPGRFREARRAYYITTRDAAVSLTESHLLFIRDRAHLADDALRKVEAVHAALAAMMHPKRGREALALLDMPGFTLPDIEAFLAILDARDAAPAPNGHPAPERPGRDSPD